MISSGGTPSLAKAGLAPNITEYRAGTYIYNDRSLISRGACQVSDCALTVLTTVVSRPTGDRAILDAGSKTLTSDLFGLQGYGMLPVYPDAVLTGLSEEHGNVDLRHSSTGRGLAKSCRSFRTTAVRSAIWTDQVIFHRSGEVVRAEDVAARGCVT